MMRSLAGGTIVLTWSALMAVGCASGGGSSTTKPATQPRDAGSTGSETPVAVKGCLLQSGGHDVLRVLSSPQTVCMQKDGALTLKARGSEVDIWLIDGVKSVDDALASVPKQIVGEFKEFKPKTTTDLTIAGAPAKRMLGEGIEADDGDPGNAEVIVFKAGDRVFVACTHGEHIPPDAPVWMLAVVQTAQVP